MIRLVIASFFLYQVLGNPIIAGQTCDILNNSWLASIQVDGYHKCVGSVISQSAVLTAAHCLKYPIGSYIVRVGSSRTDSGGSWHRVIAKWHHEHYLKPSGLVMNDIGVIKVSPPFNFSEFVKPVHLAAEGYTLPTDLVVTVAGWGAESSSGSSTFHLRSTDLNIVDSRECSKAYGDNTGTIISNNSQICASWIGTDTCLGDSGAPLMDGTIQVGIVSMGIGCADPNYPGIYTEISRYLGWIATHSH